MGNRSKNKKLAIIPVYNEQEKIGEVIAGIREADEKIDIVVIDDGSTDKTPSNARLAGARVISHAFNMGYGVALQTGYKYAFQNEYDYLVQLDGDGQHDPAYIPELLRLVTSGETDMALGSRFLKKMSPDSPLLRKYKAGATKKLGIKIFAFLTTRLVGLEITDPTSGYQAFNRRLIAFFTRDIFPCDFPDADVIVIAHRAGFKFKEMPMVMYERDSGKSMHSGLKPLYYVFKMFLSIFMAVVREKPIPLY
ncbi:MAG: glycosyltransferase family 2 protein [Desulfobacteraceae bacterium]|nr:glycosyltransferase family 2 protein [Desulfobacteraceae bacterium]MBC2718057.1 glycosyltransferase family 2 protein [Desulfobacteraceae bacterium]